MKFFPTKLLIISSLVFGTANIANAVYFNSPTGNVLCMGDDSAGEDGYVSCFIVKKNNPQPTLPKPKSCRLDWGHDFGLGRTGKAHMNCYSDFAYDRTAKILPYGKSINGKGWTCTSQKTGMRCVNKDGKGFLLSRKKQTLF